MNSSLNAGNLLYLGTFLHGTYRIDRYLSSGGFGNTYVATNIQFGEQYAIKEFFMRGISQRDNNNTTVSVSNTDNRETFASQLEKFKKEARRLRKLNNEHIVRVHDLFEENGTAYYVMDYIDGENLSDRMKRTGNPLSEAEVMQLLPQILDALQAAHKEGILHLDLKPANIMVDRQGVVKLIDFGASKQQSAQGGATTSTAVSYTNGYAPREQMEQNLEKFGPWTDFYALGATIYTLLTNKKPPLPSDIDDDGSVDKHLALQMPANCSEKLRNLVLWLMNTNRITRPQNIEEIKEYLSGGKSQGPSKIDETILPVDESTKVVASDKQIRKETTPANNSTRKGRQYYIGRKKQRTVVLASIIIAAILLIIFASRIVHSDNRTAYLPALDSDTIVSNTLQDKSIAVTKKHCKVMQGNCTYSGYVNEDGVPNGEGEAWFDDGRYYKGNFANGMLVDDHASFRYPNGATYEGAFVNDHFSNGRYTINQDKSYFIGSYDEQGQPKKGAWYDKNGRKIQDI